MELTWILIFIFAFCTMLFIALAFFLPEWVGISKSTSEQKKNQASSEENTPPQ
jgi:hypothetical protein